MKESTEGYYRSSDGLQLYYRDFRSQIESEREPVICLPGLTRNSLDFVDLAALLSRHRRVITPDLRGRGRSEYGPDRSHYHPGQYVADVWQLLEHLGLSQVAVIGTSLGGLMTMLMAYERPTVISAAVMNDIGPDIDPTGIKRVLATAGASPPVAHWHEAVAAVRRTYEHAYPNWTDSQWQVHARKSYGRLDDRSIDLRLDREVGVAAREGASGLRYDPWTLFDALQPIPLLVIRGDRSDIFSADTLHKMQQRKPDLTAVVVNNCGHAPNLNEPEAINAIEVFLDNN